MRISDWSSDVCSSDLRVVENGPYASLEPTEGSDAALAKALLGAHDHMQCWPKANIPARFHYGANRRVPPWLCLAETGWLIQPTAPPAPFPGGNPAHANPSPQQAARSAPPSPPFLP